MSAERQVLVFKNLCSFLYFWLIWLKKKKKIKIEITPWLCMGVTRNLKGGVIFVPKGTNELIKSSAKRVLPAPRCLPGLEKFVYPKTALETFIPIQNPACPRPPIISWKKRGTVCTLLNGPFWNSMPSNAFRASEGWELGFEASAPNIVTFKIYINSFGVLDCQREVIPTPTPLATPMLWWSFLKSIYK
jgi:hypothetical protein